MPGKIRYSERRSWMERHATHTNGRRTLRRGDNQLKFTLDTDGKPMFADTIDSDGEVRRFVPEKEWRQRRRILHHLRVVGLAKRLERHSQSLSRKGRHSLSSDQQRVCRCSRCTRTISQCKDTLSGSHGIKWEG